MTLYSIENDCMTQVPRKDERIIGKEAEENIQFEIMYSNSFCTSILDENNKYTGYSTQNLSPKTFFHKTFFYGTAAKNIRYEFLYFST